MSKNQIEVTLKTLTEIRDHKAKLLESTKEELQLLEEHLLLLDRVKVLEDSLRRLSYAAQTTGGGPDAELMAAIDQAELAITPNPKKCERCGKNKTLIKASINYGFLHKAEVSEGYYCLRCSDPVKVSPR